MAVPVPGTKGWYNTKINDQETIVFMRKIESVTPNKLPEKKTTYTYLNQEEFEQNIHQDVTRAKDPWRPPLEGLLSTGPT